MSRSCCTPDDPPPSATGSAIPFSPEPGAWSGVRRDTRTGPRSVALVGNPNCGKSTLFNALTNGSQPVGNRAGVTVDRHARRLVGAPAGAVDVDVIDLPGAYSLAATTPDELVTCTHLLTEPVDLVVNVVDAASIERNLYLTMQVAELGIPMIVVANMVDLAAGAGLDIDARELAAQLGCPVVTTDAAHGRGIDDVRRAIVAALDAPDAAIPSQTTFPGDLLTCIDELAAHAAEHPGLTGRLAPRVTAIRLLEHDEQLSAAAPPAVLTARADVERRALDELGDEPDILLADARYERIATIHAAVVRSRGQISDSRTERIDRIVLDRRWGVPIFLAVMYAMFTLTINVGSAFIDAFDMLGALLFVEIPATVLHAIGMPEAVVVLVANGMGGGLQTVGTFIPPVGIMFLCLRLLEEIGYMARAAFVMDRLMRAVGLPGKAFVPMIVGFGCNVPAIMGARTLERAQDRKLAVAMNPFMSCGARLPVYALFAAAFFPSSGQSIVFLLYLIGIGIAVATGLLLKRTLLTGDLAPFVMELPPYHRPSARSVLRGAWRRLRSFLTGAGKLIVPVVAALTVLSSVGTDGTYGHENTDQSVLSAIGRTIGPVFEPMGIEPDNWPATVGIFTGIFAKEAVVGTLDALYGQLGATEDVAGSGDDADAGLDVVGSVGDALATIPPLLGDAVRNMADPLGLSVGEISEVDAAADAQGVATGTIVSLRSLFDGQVGAFAYLLFVLLYVPCVAATAAIARETGTRWAGFVAVWTTLLAYVAAVAFYQLATFTRHPASSTGWLLAMAGLLVLAVALLRREGARDDSDPQTASVPSVPHPPAAPPVDAPPTAALPAIARAPLAPRPLPATAFVFVPRPTDLPPSTRATPAPDVRAPARLAPRSDRIRATAPRIDGRSRPFTRTPLGHGVSGRPDTPLAASVSSGRRPPTTDGR